MTERRWSALGLVLLACAGEPAGDEVASESDSSSSESDSSGSDSSGSDSSGSDSSGSDSTTGDPPRPERLVVTADWLTHRLSLLDYAAIRDGATTRDEALWREIDLSAWEPGPLELSLTPDGQSALVSFSPGFFTGVIGNLLGAGTLPPGHGLALIELETGTPIHEFETMNSAMHPVITADGASAWVTNYGGDGPSDVGSTIAKLDLVAGTVELEFEVGSRPHQIDLSADESLAITATASDGAVQLFGTADPEVSVSADLITSGDTGWAILLDDGSGRAFSANSLNSSSYSLIDVSDPGLPTLIETVELATVPYAAHPIGDGRRMLMTGVDLASEQLHLYEIDLGSGGEPSTITRDLLLPGGGFPLGLAYAPEDELVLIPAPGDNLLLVVSLTDESARAIPWQDVTGPSYVVIEP
ncbi:YncE family protein [Nannocystaceae bacterium ST9]